MKARFLLLGAAVAMMAGTAFAQENLLENGDFEETVTTMDSWDDGVTNVAEYIPGWDRKLQSDGTEAEYVANDINNAGFDRWQAIPRIMPVTDADVDETNDPNLVMPGSSWQYFRMQRYMWNGWSDTKGLQQTVDVVPGETYTFSGIFRVPSTGGTRDKQPAVRYIRVYEGAVLSGNGMTGGLLLAEKQITPLEDGTEGEMQPWTEFELTGLVTNSETQMVVAIGLNSAGGQGDGMPANENVRVDFDELVFAAGGGDGDGVEGVATDNMQIFTMGNILQVNGAQAGTPVNIYDIAGKLVYSTVAGAETLTIDLGNYGKGVYIANVGGQSKKFIL